MKIKEIIKRFRWGTCDICNRTRQNRREFMDGRCDVCRIKSDLDIMLPMLKNIFDRRYGEQGK